MTVWGNNDKCQIDTFILYVVIMNVYCTDIDTLLGPIIHTGLIMVSVGHVLVTQSDCIVVHPCIEVHYVLSLSR